MNRNEIIDLITLAAVYDQRTGGETDIRGWLAVAQTEHWTPAAAQRVIIEHYSRQADRPRITPAAITDGIRDARRKAAASFIAPDVPDHIAGREYPHWYRDQLAAHIDRAINNWTSHGEPIPETRPELDQSPRRELDTNSCPPQLRRQINDGLNRIGRPS